MRAWSAALAAVTVVALLAGCVPGAAARRNPRDGDALNYGLAPEPEQGVTFQPDVVLVEGGPDAVRAVTADGLTWTLSTDARGIEDLAPGRVMFLTERGVGRVVAVQTTDAGVDVTIGPVDITDVISEGDFASDAPIELDDPIALSAEGAFWSDPAFQADAGVETGEGADVPNVPASWQALAKVPRPIAPPAKVAQTVTSKTGAFTLTGSCCAKGPGTKISYSRNGLTMSGQVALEMTRPKAQFNLKISGAKVVRAGVKISGAAALTAQLHAVTQEGRSTSGFSPPLGLDFGFSVPVGVLFGVPLSMVVTQKFTVQVNIPGSAVLDAYGKVKLGATIGFRYADGSFENLTSASLDASSSLTKTDSIAVGMSYASFDYNVRFTVGLGYLGFVAGVYAAIATHLLAAVGPPLGFNPLNDAEAPIEHCKSIQGTVWADVGIGYTIPTSVAKVVNFFLEAFQTEPIPTSGGISSGQQIVLNKYEVHPQSGFCR